MRTACLLLPRAGSVAPTEPGPARLAAQVRALGVERVVVVTAGDTGLPDGLEGVEVRRAGTWTQLLEVLPDLAATSTTLDLLDGSLVAHDAVLEELLLSAGDGALVAAGTGHPGELPARVVDGRLSDVAVPTEVAARSGAADPGAEAGDPGVGGAPAASLGGPTVAGALHVGPGAIRPLQEALERLRGSGTGPDDGDGPFGSGDDDVGLPQNGPAVPPDGPSVPPDGTGAVAWLVRALVRGGTPVGLVDPRGLVLRRVGDEVQRDAARRDLAEIDGEAGRLARAVKARDGFFTTYLVSPYSRYLARWCARRGLSPDQVTVASLFLGLVAAAAFALGTLPAAVVGALALQAAFTLDCVDGQLARYARRFSARGAWLDAVFDRTKEYVVYAGLAAGAVRAGDDVTVWWLAGGALALQTLRHHLDFAFTVHREAREEPLPVRDLGDTADWLADRTATVAGAGEAARPLARGGLLGAARRLEGVPGLRWAKSIIILPIGERFAVISLGAVLLGARGTFLVLLGWGTVAAGYLATGRVLRSVRSRHAPAPAASPQRAFLDLGPVGRRLPATPLPGAVLAPLTLGLGIAAPLAAAAGVMDARGLVAGVLVAGLLLVVARPPRALDWLVPPALRAAEYGGLLALAWWAGSTAAAVSAFVLVALVAYHHYDTVYRDRALGTTPPRWVDDALGGWEGRLAVALVAGALGFPAVALAALAAWCGGLAVVESVGWWRRATG